MNLIRLIQQHLEQNDIPGGIIQLSDNSLTYHLNKTQYLTLYLYQYPTITIRHIDTDRGFGSGLLDEFTTNIADPTSLDKITTYIKQALLRYKY